MSKNLIKKIVIIMAIVVLIVVYKIFNLNQYFTLSYLKASQEKFLTLYTEHRLLVIASYMGIYILVTSLSLPGAAVMTLAGGALFGFWLGTLAVSFASTILASSVHPYPTLGEINKHVAGKFLSTKVFSETVKKGLHFLFRLKGRACAPH